MANITILDDELLEHIAGLDKVGQADWLFLTPHPRFEGRWLVDSLNQMFFIDFEEIIGQYRTVSPACLQEFLDHAAKLNYKIAWTHDPAEILGAWEHLSERPSFKLNSDLHHDLYERGEVEAAECVEATGMLPYQVQGFNFLRNPENKGGLAVWSTGTGKTVLIAALTKWYLEIEKSFDLAVVVVKSNNKFDTQIKLKQLADLDSILLEGYKQSKRHEKYLEVERLLDEGPAVIVCNYEKLRDDQEFFEAIFTGRRVVIHWDEMPTKLSNRDTLLYQAVRDDLYAPALSRRGNVLQGRIHWEQKRPTALRQYDYSATPIEHAPDGLFNQVRLIDPEQFASISAWERQHVAARNPFGKPKAFRDLELFGLDLEHMTHQVDKSDPDIARMFPRVVEEPIYIDWHPSDRKAYNELQRIAEAAAERAENDPEERGLTAIQMIGVLQMICDAPAMVQKSAENRVEFERLLMESIEADEDTDGIVVSGAEAALRLVENLSYPLTNVNCQKLKKLHEILTQKHPDSKTIVFTTWGGYGLPELEAALEEWGVTYVTYKGTDKQMQEAKSKFRNDPSIRVFLSSDAGSDSIDLPEAQVVVHYNLPWSWAKLIQRQNRAHRVNSKHECVYFYMLLMADSVEFRKVEIISRKLGFHNSVFKGQINEEAISMRMTLADLWYMVTGER